MKDAAGESAAAARIESPPLLARWKQWWIDRIATSRIGRRLFESIAAQIDRYPELERRFFGSTLPRMAESPELREHLARSIGPHTAHLAVAAAKDPRFQRGILSVLLDNPDFTHELLRLWSTELRWRGALYNDAFPAALAGNEASRQDFIAHLAPLLERLECYREVVVMLARGRTVAFADAVRAIPAPDRLVVFPFVEDHHYVADYHGRNSHKQIPLPELESFGALARRAIDGGRTLLYYDRLFTLYVALENLVRSRKDAGRELVALEIGVFRGGGLAFIASVLESLGARSRVLGFDTFEGHDARDVAQGRDGKHEVGLFTDTSFAAATEHCAPWPFVSLIQGRFEDSCARLDAEAAIDFVHLDVDVHAPTLHALKFLASRLQPGSVVVVDDYGFTSCPGAKQAVDEFAAEHPEFAVLPVLSGQAILIKTDGSDAE